MPRCCDPATLAARQSTEDSPYDPSTGSRPAIMDAIGMQTADQISEWIM